MKTNDLISLLAQDAPVRQPFGPLMVKAVLSGLVLSLTLMLVSIGPRDDFASAIETLRVAAKILTSTIFAACACALAVRIGRPAVPMRPRALLLLLPLLLLCLSVGLELAVVPRDTWAKSLVGQHAAFCVMAIPLLSLPPLVVLFLALRQGAPENPTLAGAVAGLAAAGIAACIYALHCPDDSPLFVATWYVTASAIVTAAGALAGRRFLRW
ncbi:DUF1109 domain-containing protein [Rhizobium sp. FY34]|uniref:NrsF family protein n=1 Tax=Rhizobium sp. FY34 TaxID=2562309 RepID=UPI0010C0E55E|nr:DUF1109 domain-containing protein [Rhizobium sp. FY34]